MLEFVSVFYELTLDAAQKRLKQLREENKSLELKAYILCEAPDQYRVFRKVAIPLQPNPTLSLKR